MTDDLPERPGPPVTRRYPEGVTRRFPEEGTAPEPRPTRRFEPAPAARAALPAAPIADRYRALEGPLGGLTGEAEVFRCRDEHLGREVAVKLYARDARPKQKVIQRLEGLVHPNLVRMMTHGHWRGHFYQVMEYCAGGVLADAMPLSEDALRALLPGLLAGLDFCHRQGVVHRDIKPNNLFFRDAERSQPAIGDFGISSFLETPEEQVRRTLSAANLTLDYAAPELIDGHEVGPRTDYYALGITLAHLVSGRSPFHGLSPNDVLVAHLRGRLPLPEALTPAFSTLLRGLTLGNPEARWGHDQAQAWLRGEPVSVDERRAAWALASREGHPYPGWPQARTPAELAAALHEFDALGQLRRGDIRRWLFDHFDADLADAVEALAAEEDRPAGQALARLRLLLDPESPLRARDTAIADLHGLAELLEREPGDADRRALEELLMSGLLEEWVRVGRRAGPRTPALLEDLADLRHRHRHAGRRSVALDGLRYRLRPDTPLPLGDGVFANEPADLVAAFRRDPKVASARLRAHLFSGRLEEWLRAGRRPGWEASVAFLARLRLDYLDRKHLAVWALCWHLDPDLPFPYRGQPITDPAHLARLMDRGPEDTRHALALLDNGLLRAWLVGSGKLADPTALDHALLAMDLGPGAKLEAVLHLLDSDLPQPQLTVMPPRMGLGPITAGNERSLALTVTNPGRGHLFGEITLDAYGQGLFLDSYRIDGNRTTVTVSARTAALVPGPYVNALHIATNGGERTIPVRFSVRPPPDERTWWERLLDWIATR